MDMRVSEGVPDGRIAKLYQEEMFRDHEEVIVFTREEFNRIYTSIMRQMDHVNKIDLHLDRSEEWKLIGYWPKIMQNVHRIDRNMDLIFKKEPLQSYLDAYLYDVMQSSGDELSVSERQAIIKVKASHLNPL